MNEKEGFITELFEKYHQPLKKYIASYIGYDSRFLPMVDDYVQNVFFKAFLYYDDVKKAPNRFGWLVKCFTNEFRSNYRKRKRREEIVGVHVSYEQCADVPEAIDGVLRWMNQHEKRELLQSLIKELSELERKVYYDYYVAELSLRQTAEKNDITEASARGAVQRIRSKARNGNFLLFLLMGQCIIEIVRTF